LSEEMFAGIQTILVKGRETIGGRWPSFISKATTRTKGT
jgi:hypothetical protein